MAYRLKNWNLVLHHDEKDKVWFSVTGRVYGRPGWPDGKKLFSSEIEKAEVKDSDVLLFTRNSEYICEMEEH